MAVCSRFPQCQRQKLTDSDVQSVCLDASFSRFCSDLRSLLPSTVHEAEVVAGDDPCDGDEPRVIEKLRPVAGALAGSEPMPAAELYNIWTGGLFGKELDDAKNKSETIKPCCLLAQSSNFPLRIVESTSAGHLGVDAMSSTTTPSVLLHPSDIGSDGSLRTFAEAPIGTELACSAAQPMG